MPTATNIDQHRLASDVPQHHGAQLDIPLADPHFWTMEGSVRVGQLCNDFGLMWGCHSNNHFDISLAMVVQCAAAIPGKMNGIDTHWIWQDGQDLLLDAPKIVNGKLQVPDAPGLGVHLNWDRVWRQTACTTPCQPRPDDAKSMQYLIPGWTFDNKKPCLVR